MTNSNRTGYLAMAALVAVAFAWAYWPTLGGLVHTWMTEPDYSHGFFVVPVAIFLLWARRDTFPGISGRLRWEGLSLIALSIIARVVGARYYMDPIDGWSILLWLAGAVWLFGGFSLLRWSWPAIAFLLFMVPLPYRIEQGMSRQLQSVATHLSTWMLQCLGQPALAEGNEIVIGDGRVNVAEACSGLKIFVGIVALAFAYVIVVRRAWWERAVLIAGIVPIALIANATRIALTGLLYRYVSSDAARTFAHDWAGYVTVPLAAFLFAALLWYLGMLIREVEQVEAGTILSRETR